MDSHGDARLTPPLIHLDHAGTSWPKSPAVRAAVAAAWDEDPATWPETFAARHSAVARAFGLATPDRLLITPGCTSALATVIGDLPWAPGDRIVSSSMEHHALVRPLLKLRGVGVETVFAPRAPHGPIDLNAVRESLEQGDVRWVAVSWASNVTGELLPIAELATLAHDHGARILVDGAQVAGVLQIDLEEWPIDVFAFAGHKGPGAPWGVGGLYVAPEVRMECLQAACEFVPSGASRRMSGGCDVGSVDRIALAGLAAGLSSSRDPGPARAAVEEIASAIESLPGIRLLGARPPDRRAPTIAFTCSLPPLVVKKRLAERGVGVGAGVLCAPMAHEALGTAPEGVVRISLGNTSSPSVARSAISGLVDLFRTS